MFEIFDSLGSTEEFVTQFLRKQKRKGTREFNTTRVQAQDSEMCGKYCLYFIIQRIFNDDLDFEELLNEIFEANTAKNEVLVEEFFVECM